MEATSPAFPNMLLTAR